MRIPVLLHTYGRLLKFIWVVLLFSQSVDGQIADRVYKTDYKIDPEMKGSLLVELDNISFFKDNEFAGGVMEGYSLPGLWIQPKAVFYPLSNLKLELGVHLLRYWGASRYPNMAYQDIEKWMGDQYQKGFHVLTFFRAQLALSDHVNIVLGDLYGGANHNLIDPLYTSELNLTADPEAGLQLLYTGRPLDLDVWVNWQSFIFRKDLHQEAFTVGLSSRIKYNNPESRFHIYTPVQALAQHRGGEIDTIYSSSVQTLMNGAVGIGVDWNINHPLIRKANLEVDGLGYYQQAGQLWPFDKGMALYAHGSVDIHDFRAKAGYFLGHQFISMYGFPFYGAVSTKNEGTTFKNPQTVYLGLEYSHTFAKGYAVGIDLDVFQLLPRTAIDSKGNASRSGSSTSFSAGIYLRINPSFLIKRF